MICVPLITVTRAPLILRGITHIYIFFAKGRVESRTRANNCLFLHIVIWMEGCFNGTHSTFPYLYAGSLLRFYIKKAVKS